MKADSSLTGRQKRSGRTRTSPTSFSARRYRPEIAKDKQVLLEVEAINTFRGPAHILRGVTLGVGDGEVVSLVGRNGAGRTTIIESITGLLPVRSGQIRFRGEDITKLPPHKRAKRGIGYAPENSGIFPELTVAENLMISRWLSDKTARGAAGGVEAEAQALTVFPEVAKFLGRPGLNLSGGQKKMVSIARAMALAPSLMILDEAFEGLAPVVVRRFRDAVMMIKGLGISLLLAESNLTSAAAIADRLYVIDRGPTVTRRQDPGLCRLGLELCGRPAGRYPRDRVARLVHRRARQPRVRACAGRRFGLRRRQDGHARACGARRFHCASLPGHAVPRRLSSSCRSRGRRHGALPARRNAGRRPQDRGARQPCTKSPAMVRPQCGLGCRGR